MDSRLGVRGRRAADLVLPKESTRWGLFLIDLNRKKMDEIHFMFVTNDQIKWLKSKTKMEKNEMLAKNKQVQINVFFFFRFSSKLEK